MADSPILMPGASDDYRESRNKLRDAEIDLRDRIEAVAAMRRALPPGPVVPDHAFFEGSQRVQLSELFADGKPDLIIYYLMYWAKDESFCPMCSLWLDGYNGIVPHVTQRVNFAIASRAPVDKLLAWGKHRGWDRMRLLSDDTSAFARSIGAEDENGDPDSTVVVLSKHGDEIRHVYTQHSILDDRQRGIDLLSPVFSLYDLTPTGRGEWTGDNDAFDAALRANPGTLAKAGALPA